MTKHSNDPPSLKAATLEKFHELLAADVRGVFELPVTIGESSGRERANWERERNPVTFILRAREANERMKRISDPASGRHQVVLRLGPDPEVHRFHLPLGWWLGWSEEWKPSNRIGNQYGFAFDRAAWRLYCTDENDEDTLLVRAEWDRPTANKPQNAAQPHWHIHHCQRIGVVGTQPTMPQVGSAPASPAVLPIEAVLQCDEEVESQRHDESGEMSPQAKCLEIKDIHLGMAGWYNEGLRVERWQSPLDNVQEALRIWAVATLEYMRSQLCYVRFAEAV